MKEKILLFDLDGTLIDSTDAIVESFLNTALFFGKNLKNQVSEIKSMIGSTLVNMFLHFGISQEELQECIALYRKNYERIYLQKTHLLPKVKEALESVPKHYKMGIVTSKNSYFSRKILENLKIDSYFFIIVGIDSVNEPKPSAEPIYKALEGIEYEKNQVFMIGDTYFDMQAAKNAGVIGVGVSGKYDQGLREHTSLFFDDLLKAVNYIKELV